MDDQHLPCPEPGCGGELVLKESRYGLFWGCERWSETKCPGSHGAHPDGTPLGVPATKATKLARQRAHKAFDVLWESGAMKRKRAYQWLAQQMCRTEVHIGEMNENECEQVVEICSRRIK